MGETCVCAGQALPSHFQGNPRWKMRAPVAFSQGAAVVVMTHSLLTEVNAELEPHLKSAR